MTGTGFDVISADSHVIEPHDLWQRYADPAYRDRVPRLVRGDDHDLLVGEDYEGHIGLLSGVLRKGEAVKVDGRWDDDVFPGGYDPHQRIRDLALDGVSAEVLFPTVGLAFYPIADQGLLWSLLRAYNSWLADFCGEYPDQLFGIAMLTAEDVGAAVAELRRCKDLGHVGAMLPLFGGDYRDRALDQLWATAADLELPINLHSSTYRDKSQSFFGQSSFTDRMLNTPYRIQHVLFDLLFSGVFDRHPGLVVVSTENDAGWAAHAVERGDYWWHRQRSLVPGDEIVCQHEPSWYFHRNIRHAFMRDRTAVLARDLIGMDSLMWGNDFPHHISTWPNSQDLVEEYRRDLNAEEHEKLFAGNARAVYKLRRAALAR